MDGRFVLILTEWGDVSTSKVMSWLNQKQIQVLRISDGDNLEINFSSLENIVIKKGSTEINLSSSENLLGVWMRRGNLDNFVDYQLPKYLYEVVLKEHIKLRDFFYSVLEENNNCFGSLLKENSLNKLLVLLNAQKCGMGFSFRLNISHS